MTAFMNAMNPDQTAGSTMPASFAASSCTFDHTAFAVMMGTAPAVSFFVSILPIRLRIFVLPFAVLLSVLIISWHSTKKESAKND